MISIDDHIGSGGGSFTKFPRVTLSLEEPQNPNPNDVWIKTDKVIKDVYFDMLDVETSDGDVTLGVANRELVLKGDIKKGNKSIGIPNQELVNRLKILETDYFDVLGEPASANVHSDGKLQIYESFYWTGEEWKQFVFEYWDMVEVFRLSMMITDYEGNIVHEASKGQSDKFSYNGYSKNSAVSILFDNTRPNFRIILLNEHLEEVKRFEITSRFSYSQVSLTDAHLFGEDLVGILYNTWDDNRDYRMAVINTETEEVIDDISVNSIASSLTYAEKHQLLIVSSSMYPFDGEVIEERLAVFNNGQGAIFSKNNGVIRLTDTSTIEVFNFPDLSTPIRTIDRVRVGGYYFRVMTLDGSGNIYVLCTTLNSNASNSKSRIIKLNNEGNLIFEINLDDYKPGGFSTSNDRIVVTPSEEIYYLMANDYVHISPDGEIIRTVNRDERIEGFISTAGDINTFPANW